MNQDITYDVAIVGGGLAGLSMSVHLARLGHQVILFEKERYPFHRVCGEYISLESRAFLKETGVDVDALGLPMIHRLEVSAPNGSMLRHPLPLGGVGISRHKLDQMLAGLAREAGVTLMEGEKVQDLLFRDDGFMVSTHTGNYRSRIAVGSFGKRANLDLRWQRPFVKEKAAGLNNYIGIKYHIHYTHPRDTIVLHNFPDGYCGMSAIEDGKSCLCYLTTAANLERSGRQIPRMEREILGRNPHLASIFRDAEFIFRDPVAISQISFETKSLVENHVLMAGDAAGMITPLCGNGMSMAMHAGKILTGLVDAYLQGQLDREAMETRYHALWQAQFAGRLRTGRMIQRMFGKPVLTNAFLGLMRPFPGAVDWLVRQTHGMEF